MIIGIDLSGPSNTADTVCVVFEERGQALCLVDVVAGATDSDIATLVAGLDKAETCHVGLDAPLSYNPGGGDRPSDRALRRAVVQAGLHPGSVMTPTLTRMSYLTLRGMGVARLVDSTGGSKVRVVEVHPGAVMAFGGASLDAVRAFKFDRAARQVLLEWLESAGLQGVRRDDNPSDHYVAACACALAAWKWSQDLAAWVWPACPPHHPYDFVC